MHNCKFYRNPDGTYQFRLFTNVIFDGEPVLDSKPEFVTTPFFDIEKGKYIRAPLLSSDEELERRHSESVRCSLSRSSRMIKLLALSYSGWKWFVTWTFDKEIIGNRYDYDNVYRHFEDYLIQYRLDHPDCHYIIVPELHKDGAYHFHGLFDSSLPVSFAGIFNGVKTWHVDFYGLGYTTATEVQSVVRVSHYISKYMTKSLGAVSSGRKRYFHTKSTLSAIEPSPLLVQIDLFKEYLYKMEIKSYEKQIKCIKFIDFTILQENLDSFILSCSVLDYFYFKSD